MDDINYYKTLYEQSIGKRNILLKRIKDDNEKINSLKLRIDKTEKAQLFLQIAAKEVQSNIKYHIEDMVQLPIDSCFPDKYKFQLDFIPKRNKTEANLNFFENNRIIDPMSASGGGLVNVACFAIRIAAWSLSKTNPIILLDEPFANLSENLQFKAGEILRELSEKLGFQIILITHNKNSMMEIADKVFEVKLKKDGKWDKSIVSVKFEKKENYKKKYGK